MGTIRNLGQWDPLGTVADAANALLLPGSQVLTAPGRAQ